MSVIVYRYGLRPPTSNIELIDKQLKLFNKVRNKFVEATRKYRDVKREVDQAKDKIVGDLFTRVDVLGKDVADLSREIKRLKANGSSHRSTAPQRAQLKAMKDELEKAKEKKKEAKALIRDKDLDKMLEEAVADLAGKKSKAKKDTGLFWGSSELAQAAVEQSDEKLYLWKWNKQGERIKADPKFLPENHLQGMLGVRTQLKKPLSTEGLLQCCDNRLRLEVGPLPEGASKTQARKQMGVFRMRLGGEGPNYRIPIWGEWPVLIHRPLPEKSTVMGAKIIRYRISDREKWELHLIIDVKRENRLFGNNNKKYGSGPDLEKHGDGAVFVNFGWREKENGRRIAYLRDDDGREEEILIDPVIVEGLLKVSDLESIRDRTLDTMRGNLWRWRKQQKFLPTWFADKTSHLYEWKSPKKFVLLLRAWEKEHWEGDSDGFNILFRWETGTWRPDLTRGRKHVNFGRMDGSDRHLWRWESNYRVKIIRRRNDQYRKIATDLARRYAVLVVEDWDMRDTKKKESVESDKVNIGPARKNLQQTAPGELRACMVQAFWARGGRLVKVDPFLDTQRCHICGCEFRWDKAPKVNHTCPSCGSTWDQDSNNVRNIEQKFNIMKAAGEADGEGEPIKRKGKWQQRIDGKKKRLLERQQKENSLDS